MTRDDVLDGYRPLRAGIQNILRDAPQACSKTDLKRALSQIAPWADESQLVGDMVEMMMDVALFEPNFRGQRALDRFVNRRGKSLSDEDRGLVERMGRAWFSLFRVGECHEAAGLWFEDILDGDRRIWLMDEGLETWAKPNLILGLRVFDAGLYHAAFGIITQPGDELLGACLAARARRVPLPVPMPLAAMAYAEHLAEEVPMGDDEYDVVEEFAHLLQISASRLIDDDAPVPKAGTARRLPGRRNK